MTTGGRCACALEPPWPLQLEEEQNKVEPLGQVTPQCVASQFRALPSAAPAFTDRTSGATRFKMAAEYLKGSC